MCNIVICAYLSQYQDFPLSGDAVLTIHSEV